MTKQYLTWEQIDEAVDNLANQIKESKIYVAGIHGLPRGGLIPAVMLSHRLGVPLTLKLDKYALIVDDICDSGETIQYYIGSRLPVATIHYKSTAKAEPTFHAVAADDNIWYVYPWETTDSKTIQDYKVC